jgi:ribosomal protein S15P/S13E
MMREHDEAHRKDIQELRGLLRIEKATEGGPFQV